MIANFSEFFAASVGNVDWLRFCVNPERKEIMVDDKVKLAAWWQRLAFPNTQLSTTCGEAT